MAFLEKKMRMAAMTATLENATTNRPNLCKAEPVSDRRSLPMISMWLFLKLD